MKCCVDLVIFFFHLKCNSRDISLCKYHSTWENRKRIHPGDRFISWLEEHFHVRCSKLTWCFPVLFDGFCGLFQMCRQLHLKPQRVALCLPHPPMANPGLEWENQDMVRCSLYSVLSTVVYLVRNVLHTLSLFKGSTGQVAVFITNVGSVMCQSALDGHSR